MEVNSFRLCIVLIGAVLAFASNTEAQNIKKYSVKVEESLPHDASSYTQGLFIHSGKLYESAGQYGESSLRQVDIRTGKTLKRENFSRKYFVEGSCILNDKLFILTWREHECFVYDVATFKRLGSFRYNGEGWGLTTDGKSLIMSDGSSVIRYLDPNTFAVQKELKVTLNKKNINNLNELEYINGEIWANVYTSDIIVRIDPATGIINSLVDCTGLLPASLRKASTDVLNGIAYDSTTGYIYLTGKLWPKMYRITLKDK